MEDIEDIYLFGTMITGLLLIGLGFALGYRRIQKTGTAVQSLTRLPVMFEAVGRAVSIETETINRNMDSSRRSSRLCKGKLTALEIRMDKESSRGIGMRLLAPRQNKSQSYLFRLPSTSTGLGHGRCWKINPGKSTAVRRSGVPPPFYRHLLITHTHTYNILITNTYTHIYMHSPPHPRSLASDALNRQPDKRVCD